MVIAFPRAVGAGFTPGVGNLNPRHRACCFNVTGDLSQAFSLLVVPDAGTSRRDTALRGNRGGLNDHQARAATRQSAVVHVVPFVSEAVNGAVLTHWRYGDAVAQRH